MFDFLKSKKERKFETADKTKEEVKAPEVKKRDLGVCIPIHSKPKDSKDKKKARVVEEVSPFDKLRMEHQKEQSEFNREFKEISEQASEKPFSYDEEVGVEAVESARPEIAKRESGSKAEISYDQNDELDRASEKMAQGYVPRFSSTARQKLGLEEKVVSAPSVVGEFEVTGVYVGSETMISGRVVSGKITKRMTGNMGKGTMRISDIKRGPTTATELNEGESGTIFVRGTVATLKHGDILEFS